MAARTIVTFHPDVACDMCGRRLLRGERPDVFLGGGQRRMVCELCASRATHEGWRREVEGQVSGPRTQRPARGRSLLGRLRQLREPAREPAQAVATEGRPAAGGKVPAASEWSELEERWEGIEEQWSSDAAQLTDEHAEAYPAAASSDIGTSPASGADPVPASVSSAPANGGRGLDEEWAHRALSVFNAAETPRRIAGVARALGEPSVHVAPVDERVVAIVVAWELCWYRYEIDLADEAAGVRIAAEGMELEELPEGERIANAIADERGELALTGV